jgi:hypothetical protein
MNKEITTAHVYVKSRNWMAFLCYGFSCSTTCAICPYVKMCQTVLNQIIILTAEVILHGGNMKL